jgi:hypothetical protein
VPECPGKRSGFRKPHQGRNFINRELVSDQFGQGEVSTDIVLDTLIAGTFLLQTSVECLWGDIQPPREVCDTRKFQR